MELIGTDMLFPTLPVAEKAYLIWSAQNPFTPPEPLETESADDDVPVWNVYRFSEEAASATGPAEGIVAKATHAALARAQQAAAAMTSAITSHSDDSSPDADADADADAEPETDADAAGAMLSPVTSSTRDEDSDADEPEADGSESEADLNAASNGTVKGKKGKKGNATDGNPSNGAVNGILTGARTHAGS